ncbi:hypothetical protein [Spirosoma rigui]|uniref:hypothetical protein n=1 Tax=Spirosoma rigui TaxID=564064 RepID=UPI0009AF65BB|nr:hypothetical protein [Spirosoma rigui]
MSKTTEIATGLVALGLFISAVALPGPSGVAQPVLPTRLYATSLVAADSAKKDPETGLAIDDQLTLVKGQCTACHSSKLILQSHFSRDKWIERIRWMQRTQKLWDLGDSEPAILTYLTKHYGPLESNFDGRREPLKPVKWYKLSK